MHALLISLFFQRRGTGHVISRITASIAGALRSRRAAEQQKSGLGGRPGLPTVLARWQYSVIAVPRLPLFLGQPAAVQLSK
ncbi:MAG TPA: hypothetical protein VJA21_19365 [Verrucomicrobiae bacterium]